MVTASCSCRVCQGPARILFRKRILNGLEISYFECGSCGHVQSEEPYWLDQVYRDLSFQRDTGIADRCLWTAQTTVALAYLLRIRADSVCLDWGGGTGLFVRICRDYGMDFRYHDRYAQNVFARGFEFDETRASPSVTLMTAFEVLEHFRDPARDFLELVRHNPEYILVSTKLYNGAGEDWWYFSDDGQHVAVYSRASLQFLARQHGFSLMTDGSHLHLLTRRRLRRGTLKSCFKSRYRLSARYRKRHGSRIFSDFEQMRKEGDEGRS